jgi:hypothetical protein
MFGEIFVAQKYSRAVVHIIVRNPDGQEWGGSGFFVRQPANCIVTAKHVLENRTLLRVEDREGNSICDGSAVKHFGPEKLDLAMIECQLPEGIHPFRIEWREDAFGQLDRVLIFGYPPFAGHEVGLLHARGDIKAKVSPLGDEKRYSLMISNEIAPGCSGGPVVSEAGTAIAVVSQENNFEREGNPQPIRFVSAVLTCYLKELLVQ